jgi:hypothetical protein
MHWIHVAQGRDWWRALMNIIIILTFNKHTNRFILKGQVIEVV